ncbi:MAG: hypothetical protein M0R23_09520, partial [Bacteroidales bacterium]|nr:hypothetical protein [Bacteroidales bacterium]
NELHDIQQSINQKSGYLSKAIPNRYLQALSTLILNTANYIEKFNLIYTIGSDRHHADNRYGDNYYSFEDKLIPYKKYINGIERIIKDRLLK